MGTASLEDWILSRIVLIKVKLNSGVCLRVRVPWRAALRTFLPQRSHGGWGGTEHSIKQQLMI
jgi:hypothetical protein